MHRIDGDGAVAVIPTAQAVGATVGFFAAEGVFPQTQVTGDWLNSVQEELRAIAVGKGGSLSKTNNGQCWDVIKPAVLSVEGRSDEAAAITTTWRLAVIASDDATVGESTAGVVNAAVVASDSCLAKSFQTAVVASRDSRAGDVGGNKLNGFVAAADVGIAEGDQSAVIASDTCTVGDNTTECAVIGAYNSTVDEGAGPATTSHSVIAGGDSHEIYSDDSFIGGGKMCEVSGAKSAVIASEVTVVSGSKSAAIACGNVTQVTVQGDNSAAIACGLAYGTEVSGDGAAAVASDGVTVTGQHAATLGSFTTEVAKDASVAIGCTHSKNPSGGNANVVMLASSKFDASAAVAAPAFSVCGGYGTILNPYVNCSWRIESNGGFMRSDNAHTTSGLDYAEWFPNADVEPHEPGQLLARQGRAVRLARRGDRLLGVYSVAPTVIGGDDTLGWQGQWLRDEWGAFVWQEVDGVRSRVRNPAWDATRQHAPRSARPAEHTPVGLVGQLRVRVDATVQAEDEVVASDTPGVGTRGTWVGRGAQVECMEIVSPFDESRGYAIALCLVR